MVSGKRGLTPISAFAGKGVEGTQHDTEKCISEPLTTINQKTHRNSGFSINVPLLFWACDVKLRHISPGWIALGETTIYAIARTH